MRERLCRQQLSLLLSVQRRIP